MRYFFTGVFFIFTSVLLACATVPRTSIYTIDIQAEEKVMNASAQNPALAIRVRAPRYLQQPYIAERASPYKLDLSSYSKWDRAPDRLLADALRDMFSKTGYFREVEIYNSAPTNYYSLDATLRNFELLDEGGTSLALFSIDVTLSSPDGEELYSESFYKRPQLRERSHQALAEELSLTLREALRGARDGVLKAIK